VVSGALPAGLSLSSGGVVSGTPTVPVNPANFRVRVTAGNGATATKDFQLAIAPLPSLPEAVDNLALTFANGTTWVGQTAISYQGGDAAQSGPIGHNGTSSMQTQVTGPGTMAFYWRVSSEANWDWLRVFVGGSGTPVASISGEQAWVRQTLTVPSGAQIVRWEYAKDESVVSGADAGWVDAVTFTPDGSGCTNATFLFPGVGNAQTIDFGASGDYKASVVAGRSYVVYSWAPFQDAGEGGAELDHAFYSDATCATLAQSVSAAPKEPAVEVDGHIGDNDTIIPSFTGTLYIKVANNSAASVVHTAILETTIFSPWWYVGGNSNAFAEIKNTTNATVAFTLTVHGSDGIPCATTSGSLPANGNTAINLRALGSCQTAGSGSAQLAYQGAPGALVANLTTLDGLAGLSFDAPFTPQMPWVIRPQ
jgi:hypothetical protein